MIPISAWQQDVHGHLTLGEWCPTVLSAVHVNVTSLLGTKLSLAIYTISDWKLATEALEQGYINELHIVSLSQCEKCYNLRVFICCHRNWWKGVWLRRSLIWCLMRMPLYS